MKQITIKKFLYVPFWHWRNWPTTCRIAAASCIFFSVFPPFSKLVQSRRISVNFYIHLIAENSSLRVGIWLMLLPVPLVFQVALPGVLSLSLAQSASLFSPQEQRRPGPTSNTWKQNERVYPQLKTFQLSIGCSASLDLFLCQSLVSRF